MYYFTVVQGPLIFRTRADCSTFRTGGADNWVEFLARAENSIEFLARAETSFLNVLFYYGIFSPARKIGSNYPHVREIQLSALPVRNVEQSARVWNIWMRCGIFGRTYYTVKEYT